MLKNVEKLKCLTRFHNIFKPHKKKMTDTTKKNKFIIIKENDKSIKIDTKRKVRR